jgi:hypothetical protein
MNASKNLVGLMVLVGFGMATLTAEGSIVSHYAMEGNGTDSQAVQNGILNNGPGTVTGKIGDALSFNAGVGDQTLRNQNMTVADPVGGEHRPTDVTISAWVNTTDTGAFRGLADKIEASYGIGLFLNGGNVNFTYGNVIDINNGNSGTLTGGGAADGNWYLVTGTFQTDGVVPGSGTATLYLNGVSQGTDSTKSYQGLAGPMNVAGDIPVSSTWALDGAVDDVSLWNVALSAGEARALFSLADTLPLNYDAAFASEIFNLHNLASGSAVVDGTTWYYRTDLGGTLGDVVDLGGGDFALRLDASGTGVSTIPIPEPASSVLLAFGLFALGAFRRRR